jgi:hypothetical protein
VTPSCSDVRCSCSVGGSRPSRRWDRRQRTVRLAAQRAAVSALCGWRRSISRTPACRDAWQPQWRLTSHDPVGTGTGSAVCGWHCSAQLAPPLRPCATTVVWCCTPRQVIGCTDHGERCTVSLRRCRGCVAGGAAMCGVVDSPGRHVWHSHGHQWCRYERGWWRGQRAWYYSRYPGSGDLILGPALRPASICQMSTQVLSVAWVLPSCPGGSRLGVHGFFRVRVSGGTTPSRQKVGAITWWVFGPTRRTLEQ